MTVDVLEYQISTDYTGYPNWIVPRRIVVMLDNVTMAFSVEIRTGSGTVIESPTSGPGLFLGPNGMSNLLTPSPYYQFCDGTTLKKVAVTNSFPYAALAEYPGHNLCEIVPVCDLLITRFISITPTSAPDVADGVINLLATSSNGTPKFSMEPDFDYNLSTNTTGIFTGLFAGTYTIYAKDPVGCYDSITIVVPVTVSYGLKYVGEYDDALNQSQTKIEILERAYEGASTEVEFSGNPFKLNYDARTKYDTFVASYCEIELLEETTDQFEEIFDQDERRYRVDYYKDLGSGWELMWRGYLVPQIYQQSIVKNNKNYVVVKASDQLANLKDEDFLDSSGNKYAGELSQMRLICDILKKTGLELNLRSADDIYDVLMNEAEDPLTQAFVDTRIFYKTNSPIGDDVEEDDTCDKTLDKLIRCKSGLCLFQARGYWWLTRTENAVGDFDWREFNLDAEEVDSGTYSPLMQRIGPRDTGGIKWTNASQRRAFDPNYGKYSLVHNLGFDDNFIDEGTFEAEYVIDLGNGDKAFKNWGVNLIQGGIKHGLEYVDNKDSRGAFFADFDNVFDDQADNSLYCIEIPIESSTYAESNLIKVRFEYAAFPVFTGIPYLRLAWQVRLTDSFDDELYLQPYGGWNTNYPKNDIYIEDFGKFQSFELTSKMPNQADFNGTVRIAFFFHNHHGRDFQSIADLKNLLVDEDEHTVQVGQRYMVFDGGAISGHTYFYELVYGDDAESLPDIVHPDDFNGTTNARIWRLIGQVGSSGSLLNKILIDNVQIGYVPFDPITSLNFDPPEEAKYEQTVNSFNKLPLKEQIYLGDLPEIENAKNLYRGYLRGLDGTPTSLWHRLGIDEAKLLLSIGLNDRIAQTSYPQKRIEATALQVGVYFSFLDTISYEGERFINAKYSLNDFKCELNLVLLKMETGDDGEPPVVVGEFSSAFSNDFNN